MPNPRPDESIERIRDLETEARSWKQKHELLLDGLPDAVLIHDAGGRLVAANPAAVRLTGFNQEQLLAMHFRQLLTPESWTRIPGLMDQPRFSTEGEMVAQSGAVFAVELQAAVGRAADGSVTVQYVAREPAAWRPVEEALRLVNQERYRTLFEDSPFPMREEDFSGVKQYIDGLRARGITDLRGYLKQNREAAAECAGRVKVLDVNRAARQFYGVAGKEELLGDLTGFFDDRAYEYFCEEIAVLAENNSAYQAELQVRRIDGDVRTVTMIVSLASSSRSDWSRAVVSFFDITGRKRLEEQLLQSQKMESLGRLAGGIAHDFNNLLMVIAGYSDLLLGSLGNPEKLRHGLMEIKGAGDRGAELTRQLLTFSHKQIAQPRILSLNAVIQESKALLDRAIGEDIRLAISLEPAAWTIKADRGQMNQVLINLVVNSREAMPEGGALTLGTGNVYLGSDLREGPEGAGTKPYLRLRIRDTGVGMDEPTRLHAFEPFFTTKGSRRGTGLGLATVFGIVTQSGGFLFVESEPGRGATFSVYFPRSDAPVTVDALAGAPRQALRGSGTVLVVEDQDQVRLLTCTALRGLGFEVLEAGDGMAAMLVSAEYKKKIRLLVTDLIMPGIDGRELAARLAPSRPEMKVIYMSGYTDRGMSADGGLDSSAACLQKPFTPEMLVQMVQRVLPQ